MSTKLPVFAFFCLGLLIYTASAAENVANVNAGNILTGASAFFSKDWYGGGSSFSLDVNVPLQYFVIDRLALGGTVSMSSFMSSGYATQTFLGVGPAATYYFLLQDKLGYYFSQSLPWSHSFYSDTNSLSSITAVGVNYFFTPSAAFGPSLNYSHNFSSGTASNGLSLGFAFTTYL